MGGKKKVRESIENLLKEPVSHYLEKNHEEMVSYYVTNFMQQIDVWKKQAEAEVVNYFEGLLEVLSEKIDLEQLKQIERNVSEMTK